MDLRFPIKANVNVALPLVGRLVNLEVSLDLLTSVRVEDLESENPTLVKGKCRSDPASFKLVLLDGKAPGLNRLVDSVLSLKQKIVGFLIEKVVCPVVNLLIDSQVGVIIKNILDHSCLDFERTETSLRQLESKRSVDATATVYSFQIRAQLTGVQILDVKLEVNPKDNIIDLRFPVTANVTVALPFVGRLANLEVYLDLLSSVTVEDTESEYPTVVQGKCRSDPASVKLILIDGKAPALNRQADSMLSLKKIVSFVIEKAACPLLHLVIESQVGVIIKNILNEIRLGVQVGV
ncbi:BPI fold-containing family A member 2 [Sorex fumeus]|uniref:BPI fold-containing family A member 2 n=1 Tax=Sorex fumeus TaxID=62283 RepID=UPI0024AD8F49|nr:BPI fold-containing family A member 2 [Sorex fumeus]